jgi:hypothetical protein
MKIAPHWHHDTRMTTDLRRALVIAAPANPIVATWRWRYEIALLMGLTAYLTLGITSAGVLPTIIVFVFIALTILCLPPTRQFALNHAWRIITPHRIRVGCAEAMIYSSRGKIPVILWTTRQPFGERALLLCHTYYRLLGPGHSCAPGYSASTSRHARRHTSAALPSRQRG